MESGGRVKLGNECGKVICNRNEKEEGEREVDKQLEGEKREDERRDWEAEVGFEGKRE